MKRRNAIALVGGIALIFFGYASADAQTAPPKLAADLEIELALSAAPPHLRAKAGVYLYDPAVGLVESRPSENDYTCFVARTDIQELPAHVEYRDDLLIPICFDRIGSQHIAPAWFHAEAQRAQGVSAADLVEDLKGRVVAAPRPGVSPMISPILRTYAPGGDVTNLNLPHYMYYAPSAGSEDVGGIPFSPTHPFIANHGVYGAKQAFMIQLVGVAEKAAINAEYADMLQRLCDVRADRAYCMDLIAINAGLRDQLASTVQTISNN